MDKNALKDFAMKSRENLTRMMRAKLENLHIEDELTFKQHGNIWENEQHCLPAMTDSEYKRYESLRFVVKRDGLKSVIERAAYTWFNRIVAIRYMEVNDFLPLGKNFESLGINVLCDKSGDFRNPEILTISKLRSTDLKIDYDRIIGLNDQDKYKDILLAVVKKLGDAIPDVFDGDTENIDALVPDGLLMPNGLIDNILKLGANQFQRTEIIGWLYQYYNQAEKDRSMKLKTPTTKDDIPYVTQIFTPDWVVKYLVENSLGRYWLDRHPNEELGAKWKYLVKKKEKTETIRDGKRIEDITFIDPCSGSGHILIYAFEVFYQIYESEGYPKSDIPQLILNNNLYGLDIDDRANQLSILACILVARKYDDKLFSKSIKQHILSIRESNKVNLATFAPKGEAGDVLKYLLDSFYDAKEYGSILKIRNLNYDSLRKTIEDDQIATNFGIDKTLEPLIAQSEILSKKFTIAVTNPPYMDKFNAKIKAYINDYYPDEKTNMFSVFMAQCLDMSHANEGVVAMVTPDAWMSLRGYSALRNNLIDEYSISSLAHLGAGVFEGIGLVVIPVAFVIEKNPNKSGVFIRLLDQKAAEKTNIFLDCLNGKRPELTYISKLSDFNLLPSKVFGYWLSDNFRNVFKKSSKLQDIVHPCVGLQSGDNDRFIREWWEINYGDAFLNGPESECISSSKKWFPYYKGGQFRKWYGNNDYVVNWKNNGSEIKAKKDSYVRNPSYYFKPSIAWTDISFDLSFRYRDSGGIFSSSCIFSDDTKTLSYIQGLLNSVVIEKIAKTLSPTIHFNVGQVANYPIIDEPVSKDKISKIVDECRQLSREDWDDRESSWNFTTHPLFKFKKEDSKLSSAFLAYQDYCDKRFNKLKENEETINKYVIDLYELQDELSPEVQDDRITIRKADHEREAKSLLSFFIGCVMGRYDYTKSGIQYAGTVTNMPVNNIVDEDGIITILDKEFSVRDDVINKLRKFLSESLGEKTLSENLDWIADGLGRKNTERSEDVIRNYFANEYYFDHIKTYCDPTKSVKTESRPIYWEISSGKHNAFKALFYIHRYTPNLIAKIRMDYSTPVLQTYERRRAEIETQLKTTIATTEYNRLNNELADLQNKIEELTDFDRILKNVADQKIELDLDDGVKANYPKLSLAASGVKKNAQILEAIK